MDLFVYRHNRKHLLTNTRIFNQQIENTNEREKTKTSNAAITNNNKQQLSTTTNQSEFVITQNTIVCIKSRSSHKPALMKRKRTHTVKEGRTLFRLLVRNFIREQSKNENTMEHQKYSYHTNMDEKKTNGMSKRGMGIFRSIQNRTAKIPLESERKQKQKAEQI